MPQPPVTALWPAGPPSRIALLHLDSLVCLPVIEQLFDAWGDRIGLVLASDRFGGPHGGLLRQARRNIARSGLRFTLSMGFDLVAPRVAAIVGRPLRALLRRGRPLLTIREQARRVGARYMAVADVNADEPLAALRAFGPDLVVSLHFDQILKTAFMVAANAPIINVHPAALPWHRGPCPSFWTLQAGESGAGVTIHRITDESIDAGEKLTGVALAVPPGVSMLELDALLYGEGGRLLLELCRVGASRPAFGHAPCGDGSYEGFPSAAVVRAARRRGVRLWRLLPSARLVLAVLGWRR